MSTDFSLPAVLSELRPEALTLLRLANECAAQTLDPDLLDLLQLSIESLIGNASFTGHTPIDIPRERTAAQIAAIAFSEQFVIDVSGITDSDRNLLAEYFPGEELRDFVTALYILEFTYRLSLVAAMLFSEDLVRSDSSPSSTDTASFHEHSNIRQVIKDYQDCVVRGADLDPVTTELVRLRCARTHNCRICQTLRLSDARAAGADDEMTAKVDFYESSDLDESHKIALRITDALITRPDSLRAETMIAAHMNFTPSQLAELCLDITKWSTQKIHVSLGIDGADTVPKNEQGVSFFGFDDLGQVTGYSATPS